MASLERELRESTDGLDSTSPQRPRRPQRNPLFSKDSILVVLRDEDTPCLARDAQTSYDAPCTPPRLPAAPAADSPRYTCDLPVHKDVQDAFEQRSYLHKKRGRASSIRIDRDAAEPVPSKSPPSFFAESFPDEPVATMGWEDVGRCDDDEPTEADGGDPVVSEAAGMTATPPPHRSRAAAREAPGAPSSPASLTSLPPTSEAAECARPPTPLQLSGAAAAASEIPSRSSDTCFASGVRIRGWQRIGSYSNGWVVYDVCITAKSVRSDVLHLRQGLQLSAHKRYSAFTELKTQLALEVPEHADALPPLPPRHVGLWRRYLPSFLEERRRALQAWLTATLLDERWGGTNAYTRWVLER